MDNPIKSPAVLSFCPGVLGLERGLERAIGKIRVMAYVEIEAFIIANLVAGMEAGVVDPAPIWTDAKTFDASPFRGKIHGIIGGYPCPGESLAGLREGHLYKGFLWPSIRRAISATRPLWCYFENVEAHLTGTFPIVLRSLHNMGYRVEAGIFTAEEVGATQEREREYSSLQWPTPTVHQQSESLETYHKRATRMKLKHGNGNGVGMTLNTAIKKWPTPAARDHKGKNRDWYTGNGREFQDQLPNAVRRISLLGKDSNKENGKSQEKLNPAWAIQLQGTTLKAIFFVPMVTQFWNKPQN